MSDRALPKMMMTTVQSNVLMSQIRAERKHYKCRHEPVYINSHRDENRVGKRTYKQHLYQTTNLFFEPDNKNRSRSYSYSPSPNKHTGKRTGYDDPSPNKPEIDRGKRKILREKYLNCDRDIISFNPTKKTETSPIKFTKKRLYQSPNHQNRLSPGFNLFKANLE